jgi:predicted aspartyl protease
VIRVLYNDQKQPPAPFVLVTLVNPYDGSKFPAQLDTAGDRTLVPLALLDALGLEPIDDMVIGGVGGTEETMPVFVVSLAILTLPARDMRVVAHPDEPWILLGRDTLNSHRLILDGPNLALEIA